MALLLLGETMQPDQPYAVQSTPDLTDLTAEALQSIGSESVPSQLVKLAKDLQTALDRQADLPPPDDLPDV